MSSSLDYIKIGKEDIKLNIDKNEVLRYLGYGGEKADETTDITIKECVDEIHKIIKTSYVYNIYKIKKEKDSISIKDVNIKLEGNDIYTHLQNSEKCVIMAATLGTEIDKIIKYYSKIDLTKSVIFDACASVAVEELCDLIEKEIKEIKSNKNYFITSRYSPGYGDLPIEMQHIILKLLDSARKIGLTVTDSCILVPRKSVTVIIGIGESPVTKSVDCSSCNLQNDCIYAKKGGKCGYSKNTKK